MSNLVQSRNYGRIFLWMAMIMIEVIMAIQIKMLPTYSYKLLSNIETQSTERLLHDDDRSIPERRLVSMMMNLTTTFILVSLSSLIILVCFKSFDSKSSRSISNVKSHTKERNTIFARQVTLRQYRVSMFADIFSSKKLR